MLLSTMPIIICLKIEYVYLGADLFHFKQMLHQCQLLVALTFTLLLFSRKTKQLVVGSSSVFVNHYGWLSLPTTCCSYWWHLWWLRPVLLGSSNLIIIGGQKVSMERIQWEDSMLCGYLFSIKRETPHFYTFHRKSKPFSLRKIN